MSEERKRPTRSEAIRIAAEAATLKTGGNLNPTPAFIASIDALGEAFGGFKPSPVKVPRLGFDAHNNTVLWNRGLDVPSDEQPSNEVRLAVIHRSNAWRELKRVIWLAMSTAGQQTNLTYFRDLLAILNRPEMGEGPEP